MEPGPPTRRSADRVVGAEHEPASIPSRPESTPDWRALAERHQQQRRRRRVLLAAVSALGVAGALTYLVTGMGGRASRTPQAAVPVASQRTPYPETAQPTSGNGSPRATPLTPGPVQILSNPTLDKAPLTPGGLFSGSTLTIGSRVYQRVALGASSCADGADAALALGLQREHCLRLLRATYTNSHGVAVTVAIAVFPGLDAAQAEKATATGSLRPLTSGKASLTFCVATVCQVSVNAVGRYGIFYISGHVGNVAATVGDSALQQAGDDVAAFVFDQLIARGRAEAATLSPAAALIS